MASGYAGALPYQEPSAVTVLVYASFLLCLNVVNWAVDRILYCGLIGQIFLGMAWGAPGGQLLSPQTQNVVMQLGYLGLILIVYEGGLSTDLRTLKANLALSMLVAMIGIGCPTGLSFILQELLSITPVQAFAAGAALCSTSLGTTFTVLTNSGLANSRLGVVLTSAAMMDDVVGLVMVQVISSLGDSSTFSWATIVRPIGVSTGLAVCLPLFCFLVLRPFILWVSSKLQATQGSWLERMLHLQQTALVFHTGVLVSLVTASAFIGTSNLFGAYLAGATISWFDTLSPSKCASRLQPGNEIASSESQISSQPCTDSSQQIAAGHQGCQGQPMSNEQCTNDSPSNGIDRISTSVLAGMATQHCDTEDNNSMQVPVVNQCCGLTVYHKFFTPSVTTILRPFFFASIGFSIPISRMFVGPVVWRGVIYAALMVLGKLFCGTCLMRFDVRPPNVRPIAKGLLKRLNKCWHSAWFAKQAKLAPTSGAARRTPNSEPAVDVTPSAASVQQTSATVRSRIAKPRSMYPAAILGMAMVSRGEIGFLISSVAQNGGVFGNGEEGSDLFLIVTWAILLCTIIGPVTVGLLVKRVKRLQASERARQTGAADPLGVWGIIPQS